MKHFLAAWPVIRKYKDGMYILIVYGLGVCIAVPWAALFATAFFADPEAYVRNPVYGESIGIFVAVYILFSAPSVFLFRSRRKNEAGQKYFCTYPIAITIECMENRLLMAGVTADRAMATSADKQNFCAVAEEVQRDFAILSPTLRMEATESFRFQMIDALKAKGLA